MDTMPPWSLYNPLPTFLFYFKGFQTSSAGTDVRGPQAGQEGLSDANQPVAFGLILSTNTASLITAPIAVDLAGRCV